jgi:nucleoside-diphosphate-sugar epimerase
MRVLVTGATGFIGSHLVEALVARGHDVVCLIRPGRPRRFIGELPVRWAIGPWEDPTFLQEALRDRELVFHVAGLTRAARREDFYRVNHLGTRAVVQACRTAASLRRLVYVSSLAAAGPGREGRPVHEEDPPRPITDYGRSKLLGEEEVRAEADRVPATILRPPAVYGPRDGDLLAAFRAIRRGVLPVPVRGACIDLCHVADVVAALVLAADGPEAANETYFVAGHRPVSWEEAGKAIAAALGVRAVQIPIPAAAALAVAIGAEAWGRLRGRAALLSRDKVRDMRERYWICDASKIRRALGFRPGVELKEGLCQTAAWYRQAGWL